jgi:hypothetical protein
MNSLRLHIPERSDVQKKLAALPEFEALAVWASLQAIPVSFGRPHLHSGLGIRQVRPGPHEARAGLRFRILFVRDGSRLIVRLLGTQDEVRRFLRR